MATFSERLFQLKSERGILQKDGAKGAGLSLRSYQYYETDQREPSLSALIALADFYNVSLDYLVGRSDVPERR